MFDLLHTSYSVYSACDHAGLVKHEVDERVCLGEYGMHSSWCACS
jgi:hypothetical protein